MDITQFASFQDPYCYVPSHYSIEATEDLRFGMNFKSDGTEKYFNLC